jgi:ABC-2 type transport system ATP-binding protein
VTISEQLRAPVLPAVRLRVQDLTFRYPAGEKDVLTGVSLEVAGGQVMGVLGPNGSGKSTLLKAILDSHRGRRGGHASAQVDGADVDLRRVVGFASQQIALYQQLTVAENLRHAARTLLPWRQVRGAVDQTVAEYGLAGVLGVPVERLSGGWQRLTHIAASFVHSPAIRLLDEPTAALDFEARGRLVELVGQWRRQGLAMVLTSHYPEDIEETCTHAVVIGDGAVARRGELDMLLGRVSAELVLEVETVGGMATLRRPAPSTTGELASSFESLLRDKECDLSARLKDIRLTKKSLRQLLASDPDLRELLDDDQPDHAGR